MRKLLAALVLSIVMAGSFAAQPAHAQFDRSIKELLPSGKSFTDMPLEHYLAIGAGALVGAAVFETFLQGGIFTLGGVLVGAIVGDYWYKESIWPFETSLSH